MKLYNNTDHTTISRIYRCLFPCGGTDSRTAQRECPSEHLQRGRSSDSTSPSVLSCPVKRSCNDDRQSTLAFFGSDWVPLAQASGAGAGSEGFWTNCCTHVGCSCTYLRVRPVNSPRPPTWRLSVRRSRFDRRHGYHRLIGRIVVSRVLIIAGNKTKMFQLSTAQTVRTHFI